MIHSMWKQAWLDSLSHILIIMSLCATTERKMELLVAVGNDIFLLLLEYVVVWKCQKMKPLVNWRCCVADKDDIMNNLRVNAC